MTKHNAFHMLHCNVAYEILEGIRLEQHCLLICPRREQHTLGDLFELRTVPVYLYLSLNPAFEDGE